MLGRWTVSLSRYCFSVCYFFQIWYHVAGAKPCDLNLEVTDNFSSEGRQRCPDGSRRFSRPFRRPNHLSSHILNLNKAHLGTAFSHGWLFSIVVGTSKTPYRTTNGTSERVGLAREIVRGTLQQICARQPSNQSLAICQILAQSAQPFSRRSGTLHVRTCKLGPNNYFLHSTLLTGP